ncbi:MAG TPA: hypothetical protein PK090_11945, partial [Smithellaceae bacterium]|nr:hypothetical protein [Smithellaceae bacterium]
MKKAGLILTLSVFLLVWVCTHAGANDGPHETAPGESAGWLADAGGRSSSEASNIGRQESLRQAAAAPAADPFSEDYVEEEDEVADLHAEEKVTIADPIEPFNRAM